MRGVPHRRHAVGTHAVVRTTAHGQSPWPPDSFLESSRHPGECGMGPRGALTCGRVHRLAVRRNCSIECGVGRGLLRATSTPTAARLQRPLLRRRLRFRIARCPAGRRTACGRGRASGGVGRVCACAASHAFGGTPRGWFKPPAAVGQDGAPFAPRWMGSGGIGVLLVPTHAHRGRGSVLRQG